jgi:chemotaxis protein methyltransferase CheR
MNDRDCIDFLHWALPKLEFCWSGFRKVRRQVCRRIIKRSIELGFSNFKDYRVYLERIPSEWQHLDSLCYITISRFYRDKKIFDTIRSEIFTSFLKNIFANSQSELYCLSIGCASGEEPYTLSIIWQELIRKNINTPKIRIIALDSNLKMLERATKGCYSGGSLKDLPEKFIKQAFTKTGTDYHIKKQYRDDITFLHRDIRQDLPWGPFHLILCRNIVFTYYNEPLQLEILNKISNILVNDGFFIIGAHEQLPRQFLNFMPYKNQTSIFIKK